MSTRNLSVGHVSVPSTNPGELAGFYKNLLGLEVTSRDVAEVVAELCGPRFSRTTGASVPVDGGVERVV